MKFSKASIMITVLTFLIFAVSVANLVFTLNPTPDMAANMNAMSLPMSIGIAVVMLGIFVACVVTAVKDAKKAAKVALGDDDDDVDDDDDDEDDED